MRPGRKNNGNGKGKVGVRSLHVTLSQLSKRANSSSLASYSVLTLGSDNSCCQNRLDTEVPFFIYSRHEKGSSYQYSTTLAYKAGLDTH